MATWCCLAPHHQSMSGRRRWRRGEGATRARTAALLAPVHNLLPAPVGEGLPPLPRAHLAPAAGVEAAPVPCATEERASAAQQKQQVAVGWCLLVKEKEMMLHQSVAQQKSGRRPRSGTEETPRERNKRKRRRGEEERRRSGRRAPARLNWVLAEESLLCGPPTAADRSERRRFVPANWSWWAKGGRRDDAIRLEHGGEARTQDKKRLTKTVLSDRFRAP